MNGTLLSLHQACMQPKREVNGEIMRNEEGDVEQEWIRGERLLINSAQLVVATRLNESVTTVWMASGLMYSVYESLEHIYERERQT